MIRKTTIASLTCAGALLAATASAQGTFATSAAPRPWGRVSFFTNTAQTTAQDGVSTNLSELSTSVAYQLPDEDRNRADYGFDLRYAAFTPGSRPSRTSIYEGWVGGRVADGALRFRFGHMWLNDLGSLGSVAGAMVEWAQPKLLPEDGRFRVGGFVGLEPNVLDTGYAPNVKKYGVYAAYEGGDARRHSVGYVTVRNGSLTERSVVSTSNFVPIHQKLFLYQAAEYDIEPPAGQGERGLSYFLATARVLASERVELQGTFSRGRAIDARSLSEDVLTGRPVTQLAVEGYLYESIGGRVTVEVVRRVRVYGGYARDKNNRDAQPGGRTMVGGYASDVAGSGLDLSASETLVDRAGGGYHSGFISVGRQIGRRVYVSGDYTTSLSLITFTRTDGITIETRPHTVRYSGTVTANLSGDVSLLGTVEESLGDTYHEFRVLSGITYRIR